MRSPFGYSLLMDCFDCGHGLADSLEVTYRYLEELVDRLDMTKMAPPIVIHGPRDRAGNELFPDKAGVSGWVPLIESGIQIHSLEPSHFITIDVYSCRMFDQYQVIQFTQATFQPSRVDHQFIYRG